MQRVRWDEWLSARLDLPVKEKAASRRHDTTLALCPGYRTDG
jgi:hypothetical protein